MRQAVIPQTTAWKNNRTWKRGALCPITGKTMLKKSSEADHFPTPFIELVEMFLAATGLTENDIPVSFDVPTKRWGIANAELLEKGAIFMRSMAL